MATWGDPILLDGIGSAIKRSTHYHAETIDLRSFTDTYDYMIYAYSNRDLPLAKNCKKKIYYLQVPREEEWIDETMKHFDGIMYASQSHYEKYKDKYGGIVFHMSADQEVFRKCERTRDDPRVTFVGNFGLRSVERYNRYLSPLLELDNLDIYGAEWNKHPDPRARSKWRGILPPEQLPSLYSRSDIVLSIHGDAHFEADMVTTRIFEALGCGAYVISDKCPMAMEMFGDTIGFVDDGNEALELIRGFQSDIVKDMQRVDQCCDARDLFYKNYTFDHQVEKLIEYLENL